MAGYYIPQPDTEFNAWALNFSTLITATPTAYGLTASDASTYAAARTAFSSALTAALDPNTRTSVTVAAKGSARANLELQTKSLAAKVQATPTVTDAQLTALGLTVRSEDRTPISAPTVRPLVSIVSTGGGEFGIRASSELTPDSRALPANVIGLQLFTNSAPVPSEDLGTWVFAGTFGKQIINLDVARYNVGTLVHVRGRYITRRGLTGPVSIDQSQVRAA